MSELAPELLTKSYEDSARCPRPRTGTLNHIRVADFCWAGVGACATRLLADFGAQVIKIEDRKRMDLIRRAPIYKGQPPRVFGQEDMEPNPNRSGMFNNYNRNKLGVTIDMRSKKGKEVAERLISKSNIVTENFAPDIMEKWGLTYDRLKELRSDIIYGRMSGFGHSGPDKNYRSYGPVVQAVSGLSYVSGLPGREPSGWGLSYMDNQAAYLNSVALLNAIYHHMRTGEGTEIGTSAVEAGIRLLGPILLDVTVNKRSTKEGDYPTGNRLEYPYAAPHGVYPSIGEDQWIAIAVFNDEEWDRLVDAIGNPDWAKDSKFVSQDSRFHNQDALDNFISEWTKKFNKHEAMNLLQGKGVRAAAVQNGEDINENDPQVKARQVFYEQDHPVAGWGRFEGAPITFSRLQDDKWRSAPLIGEDNAFVFKTIVGMDDDEYDGLVDEGVI